MVLPEILSHPHPPFVLTAKIRGKKDTFAECFRQTQSQKRPLVGKCDVRKSYDWEALSGD